MMSENINIALQITVVGMGLVFAAILILWGLMAILVRVAPERQTESGREETALAYDKAERKRRAAAIAVAAALAQQADITEPHEFLYHHRIVSAWQAVMRTYAHEAWTDRRDTLNEIFKVDDQTMKSR
jgi:Na+-transporting methylmalonyl-CoA/oxaloacetate decarboxylase gamma subunit